MIYIIEDDIWHAEQYSRDLKAAGMESEIFSNGIDAINAIDKKLPDVIVLDMLLTGSTGITLLHELQSYGDTGAIPVVVCTGISDGISLEELKPYGVKRILDKANMQPDDVVTAVKSVMT